ncbi:MAG: DUF370 domain-containing protein [Sporomusaceae bacterium]|jgi:hypothetical protein|nr:DUF370 domain-containing protein [Sporomusaceae bacterium]
MFLHLGVDVIVPLKSVIGIFDVKITKSKNTESYLNDLRKSKKLEIIDVSESEPKSFIVTEKAVYFSTISSMTLKKRSAFLAAQ